MKKINPLKKSTTAKSAAMQQLRRLFRLASYANAHKISAEEAIAHEEEAAWSRRKFLQTASLATLSVPQPHRRPPAQRR